MMKEDQIREDLLLIQSIYHTPCSKIAKDLGLDSSTINKFINNKIKVSDRILNDLEQWILVRL